MSEPVVEVHGLQKAFGEVQALAGLSLAVTAGSVLGLSDEEFEAAFGRIRDRGITHYADPGCRQPGEVYTSTNGRRGTYFRDPDGHLMEILTPISAEQA